MSISQSVYIGCYLRVYMPTEEKINPIGQCVRCGRKRSTRFCDDDGGEVAFEMEKRMMNFHSWAEDKLGDEDMFATASTEWNEDLDYQIVIANKKSQSGHINVGNEQETDIPPVEFFGDWITLMGHLEMSGIRYEKKFGVVSYWS